MGTSDEEKRKQLPNLPPMLDNESAPLAGVATERASPLAIHLFGPFEVCLHGNPLPRLRSRKGQWLLALLTLRHGGEVDRSWLAGTLWPDSLETAAFASLRNCLKDLRRALGPEADRLRSPTPRHLALDLEGAQADVVAFDAAIAQADVTSLERAIALYRGPLLEEWTEEWAFQERQVREQAYLTALETLAHAAQERGDRGAAERHLRRAVAVDSLRETAQRALMQALAAAGNYAAASEVYRELRLRLHRELNAEPDPETQVLFQQIRAEAREKAAGSRQWAVSRKFKDVSRPSTPRVVPGLPADFPPLRSFEAFPQNLPLQLTRFIGREDQMAEVEQLLCDHRLVTLTGAGGCGKTRLALQVAAELLETFPDGVWFVDLAPLADPELVPQTVATALGLQEAPGRPPAQRLGDYLKPRQLLLVLDNCEHLIEACAQLVHALLQSGPQVRVLATSREALGITGERSYRVPPLSLPDAGRLPTLEQLTQYEAVRLFRERAVAVLPSFQVSDENARAVAEVCQRLDGIPLAIELAAAWVKLLSVEQLAQRLDDRFRLLTGGSRIALPRQQTLRALIDWSYDLLSREERAMLRRLSVFAGGWTLESAEAVCSGRAVGITHPVGTRLSAVSLDGPAVTDRRQPMADGPDDVLNLLSRLVDKSLVIAEPAVGRGSVKRAPQAVPGSHCSDPHHPAPDSLPATAAMRYRLLETVRQYARDRLREEGEEEEVRRRHYEFFLRLAEEAEPELRGPEHGIWLDRLDEEHDNQRVALDGCEAEAHGAATGVRLAGALCWFWVHRGYSSEGRQRLERVLSRGSGAPPAWRAKALQGAWTLAYFQGDHELAQTLGEEGLALAQEAGDPWLIAYSLYQLGMAAADHGDRERAAALATESLARAREVGDPRLISHPLLALGGVAGGQGNYERATGLLAESLALARQTGDRFSIAIRLMNLGLTAQAQGNLEQAGALCREGLVLCHELKNQRGIAWCLEALAGVAGAQGRAEQVAQLLGAIHGLLESISLGPSMMPSAYHERNVATACAALGEDAFAAAWAAGRAMPLEQIIASALTGR